MAVEAKLRSYHSTAMLLPDARVLSSGSGEGGGVEFEQSEFTAQIFSPPYLFNPDGTPAPRPVITSAPSKLTYGQSFMVQTPDAATVTTRHPHPALLGHPRVQHEPAHLPLSFTAVNSTSVRATAPASGNLAPPGPYMLFLVNGKGVPSKAKMVTVGP